MQDDARFAWIVLVPRRAGLIEVCDLDAGERGLLLEETLKACEAVRAVGEAMGRPVSKLNLGQLGNVVAQLHVHAVGRREDDAAWPGPVWGSGMAEPYGAEALEIALAAARRVLR